MPNIPIYERYSIIMSMDSHNGNTITLVATLATTLITRKLQLDNVYYGIIFPLLLVVLNNVKQLSQLQQYMYLVTNRNIIIVSVLVAIYWFYKYGSFYLGRYKIKKDDRYMTIKLFDEELVIHFKQYIGHNKKMYLGTDNISYSDLDMEYKYSQERYVSKHRLVFGELDIEQKFTDSNFSISGFMTWRKFIRDEKAKTKDGGETTSHWIHIYPEFRIDKVKSKIDFVTFMDKIIEYLEDKNKNRCTLTSVKVFVKRGGGDSKNNPEKAIVNHSLTFYDGIKTSLKAREKTFIDSFFHKEKIRLWNTLKNIHYHPEKFESFGQSPRMNLLLHGPPGSGKSSLIYRFARCLERHVVSIDLRHFETKDHIYQVIQRPSVGAWHQAKDAIIVLEEIDIAIKELYKREQVKQKMETVLETVYDQFIGDNMTKDETGTTVSTVANKDDDLNDIDEPDSDDDNSSDDVSDSESDGSRSLSSIDSDTELSSNPKGATGPIGSPKINPKGAAPVGSTGGGCPTGPKGPVKPKSKGPQQKDKDVSKNKKGKGSPTISSLYHLETSLKENDFTRFCLRDLLDIFQGTIPVNGSIILATTNNFEEIKSICPELFRNGRMTPVYFGYLDKDHIQQMVKYYFGKELEIELPKDPNIQTSALVEVAMEMKMLYDNNEEAFGHFQEAVINLLKK